ncbi:MAG: hypothetical protein ABIH46_13020 [Chloroflexota bacterium]
MALPAWIPKIDGAKFRRSFVLKKANTFCQSKLWPELDRIGEDRLRWLISHNESLVERIARVRPDWKHALAELGTKNAWAVNVIQDQDLVSMLPPWIIGTVAMYGKEGQTWLAREVVNLRTLFTGGEILAVKQGNARLAQKEG